MVKMSERLAVVAHTRAQDKADREGPSGRGGEGGGEKRRKRALEGIFTGLATLVNLDPRRRRRPGLKKAFCPPANPPPKIPQSAIE